MTTNSLIFVGIIIGFLLSLMLTLYLGNKRFRRAVHSSFHDNRSYYIPRYTSHLVLPKPHIPYQGDYHVVFPKPQYHEPEQEKTTSTELPDFNNKTVHVGEAEFKKWLDQNPELKINQPKQPKTP